MTICLLCVDLQNDFFSATGILGDKYIPIHKRESIINNIHKLIKHIPNLKVYWVRSFYDNSHKPKKTVNVRRDEKPLNSDLLQGSHNSKNKCCYDEVSSSFIPEVHNVRSVNDKTIKKTYYSAFTDTELLQNLKNDNITDLIICGVTTNNCVMATTVDAYHLGFHVNVPFDCTEARCFETKKKALDSINLYYGSTIGSNELCKVFGNKPKISYFGEGDSVLIEGVFSKDESDNYFNSLKKSTKWNNMMHKGGEVPRLISIQHSNYPNCKPIYRHPADVQPKADVWNINSKHIKNRLAALLGINLNHALVQFYRSGLDYISEHADKTLDIRKETPVVNVSFGSTRTLKLRSKYEKEDGTREIQNVKLKHGSIFILGWDTNKKWLHSIKQDKRIDSIKEEDVLAFNGERISLTMRDIATFKDNESSLLFGQGAPNGEYTNDAEEMLVAFGVENKSFDFNWDDIYGKGFHSLNFKEI